MISLQYSKKQRPYINLGDYGTLIFSTMTKHPEKGYKWLSYNRRYVEAVVVNRGENKRVYENNSYQSFVFDFSLKRDSQGKKGLPANTIPKVWAKKLVGIFDILTNDIYFPYDAFTELEKALASVDWDKLLDSHQRKLKW